MEVKNYEIVKKINKPILTEEEKKTLVQGLPDDTNYIQAAYFQYILGRICMQGRIFQELSELVVKGRNSTRPKTDEPPYEK